MSYVVEPSMADKSHAAKTPKVTIKIPRPLYHNLQLIVEQSGFDSVTDFVVYVLRDLVASAAHDPETPLSKDELESVRRHLRLLGYLP
jgi:Arc/MetJ-type ribon-helix-helix transcriptional regulator